jgi:triosephosphate isomerase
MDRRRTRPEVRHDHQLVVTEGAGVEASRREDDVRKLDIVGLLIGRAITRVMRPANRLYFARECLRRVWRLGERRP